jgi:hypothetical protein
MLPSGLLIPTFLSISLAFSVPVQEFFPVRLVRGCEAVSPGLGFSGMIERYTGVEPFGGRSSRRLVKACAVLKALRRSKPLVSTTLIKSCLQTICPFVIVPMIPALMGIDGIIGDPSGMQGKPWIYAAFVIFGCVIIPVIVMAIPGAQKQVIIKDG